MAVVENRYDFVLLFDVTNGNPNGDPDADNLPRTDAETGHGLVTDVCLKRKIRDYVQMKYAGRAGFDIYIKTEGTLNAREFAAIDDVFAVPAGATEKVRKDIIKKEKASQKAGFESFGHKVKRALAHDFYDIRTFGAVLTKCTSLNITDGQVLGPVQFDMARSIDPVTPTTLTITRMAVSTEGDKENKGSHTMGNKTMIPYGLYCVHGFVSAPASANTDFSYEDLNVLWDALLNMFEHDRAASRGFMSARKLIVFEHESQYGNAHAYKLFDRVSVVKKPGVMYPRSYSDYEVSVDTNNLPSGVTVYEENDAGNGIQKMA